MLKIHMPPTFLHVVGLSLLAEFRRAFPGVPIDVSSSNGVGLPVGRSVDLAVVFDRPHLGDAIRDPLWMVSQTPACAPAMAERAASLGLAAFLRANELLHVKLEGEPFGTLWSIYTRHHGIDIGVRPRPRLRNRSSGRAMRRGRWRRHAGRRRHVRGRARRRASRDALPAGRPARAASATTSPSIRTTWPTRRALFRSWVVQHYRQSSSDPEMIARENREPPANECRR